MNSPNELFFNTLMYNNIYPENNVDYNQAQHEIYLNNSFVWNRHDSPVFSGPFNCLYKYRSFSRSKSHCTHCIVLSLFMDEKYSTDINSWILKYVNPLFESFNNFLKNILYREFSILCYIDFDIFNLVDTMMENFFIKNNMDTSRIIILYYDRSYRQKFGLSSTVYFGNIIRLSSLAINDLRVVLFRDKNTMPNNKTPYDAHWKNYWVNSTTFKYWIYNNVSAQKKNNYYYNSISACGFKWVEQDDKVEKIIDDDISPDLLLLRMDTESIIGRTTSIMSVKPFENYSYALQTSRNGCFERCMNLFSTFPDTKEDFIKNTYFVGISKFKYIFYPKINMKQFSTNYITDPATGQMYDQFSFDPLTLPYDDYSYVNTKNNVETYQAPDSIIAKPFYAEAGCLFRYLEKSLYEETNTHQLVNNIFMNVEMIKNKKRTIQEKLLSEIYNLVPSRWHISEFLFDIPSSVYIYKPLSEYIEYISDKGIIIDKYVNKITGKIITVTLNINNMCDLVPKFYKGNEYEFEKHMYNIKSNDDPPAQYDMPQEILLPENYDDTFENLNPHKRNFSDPPPSEPAAATNAATNAATDAATNAE